MTLVVKSICSNEVLTPIYPNGVNPEFLGMKKNNKVVQMWALASMITNQLVPRFSAPVLPACSISRFYISDTATTTEVTTGDIFTYIRWNSRANPSDAISVLTNLLAGSYSKVIDFRIQVVLGTGNQEFLNPQSYSMQLKIGCFSET